MVIICRDLTAPVIASRPRIPCRFRILTPAEVEERLAHLPPEHTPDLAKRIRDGQTCLVGEYGESVCYMFWASTETCYSYLLDREYPLARDEAYVHGGYTLPQLRGYGLHTAGLGFYAEWLRARGVKRVFGFVQPHNAAAIRAALSQGYRLVGTTGFVEVFGFRWYFHWDRGAFTALGHRHYWRKM